jgi:DNA replication and repair protein RecF
VGTGRDLGSERRIVRIDGQAVRSQAMLSDVVSLLWLTPAMDRLFGEGAGGRRRFLDRLVLGMDPKHGRRAASYDHALKERSRLLGTGQFDHTWVDALEETMAHQGVAMAGARMEAVKRLNAACADGIGPFPAAELIIAGDDADLATRAPEQAAARFQGALAESRRRDTESGTTLMGPHRSDLIVRHRNKGLPAGQCSTGEQKAVLIAIILGQARVQSALHGAAPILLLDEVAAHLDRERRAALFGELCALSAQSWMTGTEDALFADMGNRGQIFHVDTAVVTALS